MGNEASLIRKCQISAKPRHTTSEWSIFDATHNTTEKYSLIVFNEQEYTNDVTRWKHIRHPNLVKCYEAGLNKAGKKCILLEPVEPIGPMLESMHSARILSGLFSIGEVLSFLHERCGLSINNLSLNSIFVSQKDCDERWKLGSLYWCSSLDSDSTEFFKQLTQFHHAHSSIEVMPPEDREIRTHQLIRSSKLIHRRDSHSFVALLNNLLVNNSSSSTTKQSQEDFADETITNNVRDFVAKFSAIPPEARPRIESILSDKLFVNCAFLEMRQFFVNFSTHSNFEKSRFFETFVERLRLLPNELLVVQIFRTIVTSRVIMSDPFIYSDVMPHFLVPVQPQPSALVGAEISVEETQQPKDDSLFTLTNGETVSLQPILLESTFSEHIVPLISNLYCVHDLKIRLLLLQYLPHYAQLFPKNHLRKVILPQILLGIKDSDSSLVSLTFRSLAILVDSFDVVTVLGGSKRTPIFTTEAPRTGALPIVVNKPPSIVSNGDHDNVSVKSAESSLSSSMNFLTFKLRNLASADSRTSPDGDETDRGLTSHKDINELNSSMTNLNLVEDDDEWPEWENGNDSSSQFETAAQSFASSADTLNSAVNSTTKTVPVDTGKPKNPTRSSLQTFDIKEIDFHESKAEIDNIFQEMEPVFNFKKNSSLPKPQIIQKKTTVEEKVQDNHSLFLLQNHDLSQDGEGGAWGDDDDELHLSDEEPDEFTPKIIPDEVAGIPLSVQES